MNQSSNKRFSINIIEWIFTFYNIKSENVNVMNILPSRLYRVYSVVRLGVLRCSTMEPKRKWKMRVERASWGVRVARQTSCTFYEYFTADTQQLLSWTPRDGQKTKKDRQIDSPPPNAITAHGQPSQAKSHTPTFPEAGLTGSFLQCWQRCLPSPSWAHHYTQETLTTRQPSQITCKHENCRAQTECFVRQESDASVYWKGKWVEETRRGHKAWVVAPSWWAGGQVVSECVWPWVNT